MMKRYLFCAALLLAAIPARAFEVPTAEQRLSGTISALILQLAHAGEQLDRDRQQIDELKAKLKPAEKDTPVLSGEKAPATPQ